MSLPLCRGMEKIPTMVWKPWLLIDFSALLYDKAALVFLHWWGQKWEGDCEQHNPHSDRQKARILIYLRLSNQHHANCLFVMGQTSHLFLFILLIIITGSFLCNYNGIRLSHSGYYPNGKTFRSQQTCSLQRNWEACQHCIKYNSLFSDSV